MAYSSAWLAGDNFHTLLAYIVGRRLDYRRLCADSGIDWAALVDRSIPLPFDACLRLFENAAIAAEDPWFGLHFGETEALTPTLSYYLQTNSPTVEHALRESDRLVKLCTNALDHSFYRTKRFGACRYVVPAQFLPCDQFVDFLAARKVSLIRSVLGTSWYPMRILMQRSRPDDADELHRVLGPRLTFDSPVTEVQLSFKHLGASPREADPALLNATKRASNRILLGARLDHEKLCRIKTLLTDRLSQNNVTLKLLAEWAGMKPSEVKSVLADAGLSFKHLLDSLRQEQARKLLTETEVDLTEIAFMLGFSELSAFSRAARNWFGQSPSQYRLATSQGKSRRRRSTSKPVSRRPTH